MVKFNKLKEQDDRVKRLLEEHGTWSGVIEALDKAAKTKRESKSASAKAAA